MVIPRFASLSLRDDFTTEDKKLVAKCSILLTGLSSGLLLSMASIPWKVVIAALAFANPSLSGSIASATLIAYLDTASKSATFSC